MAWNWEHDGEFVALLEAACRSRGITLLAVTPGDLEAVLQALHAGQIAFRVFFDRASDVDERFLGLVQWARLAGLPCINSYERARCAWDKAAMHQALSPTLPTPYTIVVPPYNEQPDVPALDLPLGQTFDVKPAHGGGGHGVVMGATTLDQVHRARQEYPADTYLLQAHVEPALLDGRPAWFRVLSCTGQVFPCWWHPETHLYTPVTIEDEARYGLEPLRHMTTAIALLCSLELFSSEIALTADAGFVVVDYVNDPIDLRLQSRTADGVPDAIVHAVASALAEFAAAFRPPDTV